MRFTVPHECNPRIQESQMNYLKKGKKKHKNKTGKEIRKKQMEKKNSRTEYMAVCDLPIFLCDTQI